MCRSTGLAVLFLSALWGCSATPDTSCRQTCAPDEFPDCETGGCYREPCSEGNFRQVPLQGIDPISIWGSDPNNVWIVGKAGMIRRWDGSAFVDVPSGTTNDLYSIWGLDSMNIWVGGVARTLVTWDGVSWTSQILDPGVPSFVFWGSAPNNLWSVEDNKIFKWDGSTWALDFQNMPYMYGGLNGLWGSDADHLWAIGYRRWDIRQGSGGSLSLFRRDGMGWTEASAPSGGNKSLSSIWGLDANHVWAVSGESGQLIYWDGAAWALQDSGTKRGLNWIRGSDFNNVWAVGDAGKIVRWDGSRWSSICSGTATDLREVWVGGPNDVWILDYEGRILRNDR